MNRKPEKTPQAEWPVQFGRAGACNYLLVTYEIPMSQAALTMHDKRGTGPERRVVLNRTYYLRAALDKWVAEMGERGARRRRRPVAA
jgi:hypothetical protein